LLFYEEDKIRINKKISAFAGNSEAILNTCEGRYLIDKNMIFIKNKFRIIIKRSLPTQGIVK